MGLLKDLGKMGRRELIKEMEQYNNELKHLLKMKLDNRSMQEDSFDLRIKHLRYMVQCIKTEIEINKLYFD
ncbi:MAG: hypothetical protein ACRCXT_09460 [Paraclostridium sp.]